jgi:TRAP-type mannitol/chloroaromatic compound transport system permease large subunit
MFHSVQLAFRRVPASLAVTTLLVCAFWGIASGIVGAVVVLMGVIALRPMLKAGYDIRLASGAITAGGTLGILIPPSVMLIVYAAVAGQSIVKLYAAAMLPGFFLTFLYLLYILGWAIINPKIAPKLSPDEYRVAVPETLQRLERGPQRRIVPGLLAALVRPSLARAAGYRTVLANVAAIAVPVALTAGTMGATWWSTTRPRWPWRRRPRLRSGPSRWRPPPALLPRRKRSRKSWVRRRRPRRKSRPRSWVRLQSRSLQPPRAAPRGHRRRCRRCERPPLDRQ